MTSTARRGGRDARRALRTTRDISMLPQLRRGLPYVETLTEEQVMLIHNASMAILEDVGVEFRDPVALEQWKAAGAKVVAERVYIDRDPCDGADLHDSTGNYPSCAQSGEVRHYRQWKVDLCPDDGRALRA